MWILQYSLPCKSKVWRLALHKSDVTDCIELWNEPRLMLSRGVFAGAFSHPATCRLVLYLWQGGCSLQQKPGRGFLQTGTSSECNLSLYASIDNLTCTTENNAFTFDAALVPYPSPPDAAFSCVLIYIHTNWHDSICMWSSERV